MRRVLATLCIAVLAVFIGYKVVFGANGMMVYKAKRAEYQQLLQEIDEANRIHEQYETTVKALQTEPEAIVKVAREQLGYVKKGEVVLVQPQPKRDLRSAPAVAEKLDNNQPPRK